MTIASRQADALSTLLEVVVLLSRDMAESLARDGLTASRAHLLWELHQRGPVTQKALADAMSVSARNVTGLVDGLVDTGFVTREPHPTDRRATLVTFTPQGAATGAALEQGRRDLGRYLFAGLPRDRFETFVATLDEVLVRLRAAIGGTS
jgi:DNA-binding MarR family transcriptional regulator